MYLMYIIDPKPGRSPTMKYAISGAAGDQLSTAAAELPQFNRFFKVSVVFISDQNIK